MDSRWVLFEKTKFILDDFERSRIFFPEPQAQSKSDIWYKPFSFHGFCCCFAFLATKITPNPSAPHTTRRPVVQVRRIDTAKDIAENLAKSPNVMWAFWGTSVVGSMLLNPVEVGSFSYYL